MKSVSKFNGLNGAVVSQEEIALLHADALRDEQYHLADRLQPVLAVDLEPNQKIRLEISEPEIAVVPPSIIDGIETFERDTQPISLKGLGKAVTSDQIYSMIAELMINTINKVGHLPWQKEWIGSGIAGARNFVSGKPYTGINFLTLNFNVQYDKNGLPFLVYEPDEMPYYLTFNQIEQLGARLKPGSKGREVVYYNFILNYKDGDLRFSGSDADKFGAFADKHGLTPEQVKSNLKRFPILKYYNVYRADDCEGLKIPKRSDRVIDTNQYAEFIIENYPNKPEYRYGSDKAFYVPSQDFVSMPLIGAFRKESSYYSTFFHEIVHSTGHPSRLDRDMSGTKRSKSYAFEELIAELGAVFLSAEAGILFETRDNSAKYLAGWNKRLVDEMTNDNRFFSQAAAAAQKAAKYILDTENKDRKDFLEPFEQQPKIAAKKTTKPTPKPLPEPRKRKPASDYGKKRKFERKPVSKYPFSKEDIPYNVAYDAHRGTSFSPEKRAESEQNSYYNFLKEVYDENREKAQKVDALEVFEQNFARFQSGYLKKTLEYLRSRNGLISTMIAGGSKFPVERMNKKNRVIEKRLNELVEFGNVGQKRLISSFTESTIIKTGSSTALDQLKAKLATEKAMHERNLAANKIISRIDKKAALSKEEKIEAIAREMQTVGFTEPVLKSWIEIAMRHGLSQSRFFTTNSNARIKRIEQQIRLEEKLNVKKDTGNIEYKFDGGTVLLNYEVNRVQIFFDEKPSEAERQQLKKSGNAFKWSPTNKAWQRQLNTYNLSYLKALLPGIDLDSRKTIRDNSTVPTPAPEAEPKTTSPRDALNTVVKQTRSKQELEKLNPAPFSKKPKSISVATAIDGVLTLAKFKGIKPMQANLLYNIFKDGNDDNDVYNLSEFQAAVLKSLPQNYAYVDDWEIEIKDKGKELVAAIAGRVASLRNQKFNLALFDGLAGTRKALRGIDPAQPEMTMGQSFEPKPEMAMVDQRKQKPVSSNPKVQKIGENGSTSTAQYYTVTGEVGKFLQRVEKKPVHSVVITLDGEQGAGKTTTLYKFMDAFAAPGNSCLFISGEEHPQSALAKDKATNLLSTQAQKNIDTIGDLESAAELYNLIASYDIIFIDSWQKLLRMVGYIRLDEDLRKRFDGKVFVIIFQQTTTGRTKGGAEVVFDGDIIIKMVKEAVFSDNYAYFDKHRYTLIPLETIRYNIASGKVYNPIEPEKVSAPANDQAQEKPKPAQAFSFKFVER